MLYSILLYDSEAEVESRTRQEDADLAARHAAVQRELAAGARLGPVVRLMPTTAATTVRTRAARGPAVVDGPYAEGREALLGVYVVDCLGLEEAISAARRLPRGTFEIRPIAWFHPGVLASIPTEVFET